MADELAKHNLFFDYLYNLRLLDPQLSTETNELKEKCEEYTESEYLKRRLWEPWYFSSNLCFYIPELQEFRQIIDDFIKIAEGIVVEVEDEKLNAIGAQNILKSLAKQKETKEQDIQVNLNILFYFVFYNLILLIEFYLQNQIMEKTVQLEQLKIQLQYLQRIEADQEDLIHNFYEDH